ncbi:MAG: OmpA family protein [Bacteroidales bacterium]|jgi:outer membrane protein OmpA-like peptidoglycan-associated protein/tetratricopeptide (TPR) repeat protein|nr:OmpA family protein [Bacteroidales bacterium]
MKRIITVSIVTLVCLIGSFEVNAQSQSFKSKLNGTPYFEKNEYAIAIPAYESDLKRKKITRNESAYIETQIGISYYYLNNPKEAVNWLKKGMNKNYQTAETFCIYGLSLQKLEKYEDALVAFKECLQRDKNYPNIDLYIQSCEYALSHPDPNTETKMRSSKINTDGSEYGISPADGELFFSRASTKGRDIDPRTGLGFTEIFSTKLDGNDLTSPKKEKAFMKTYYNTGIFAYDSATNHMYMTTCDPKSGKCGIYRSTYNRRKWEKPEPFFINDSHDMAHPALSKNGTRLYFSSNAADGKGKTDLWYVDRKSEDQWGEPVNLGEKINTSGREEFPFIEGDSILYFASDGHPGYGGLDIFAVSIDGDEFGEVINLGRPFNSGADDFNLISFSNKGLLISSRNTSKSDDIYIFDKKDLPSPPRKQKPKPELEPEPEPEIIPEVIPEIIPEKTTPKPTPVKPATNVVAVIYFDFDRFVPQREYRNKYKEIVALMKAYPNAEFEISGYADSRGGPEFNQELSEKRADYVAKRLVDRGIKQNSLVIKGYGNTRPAIRNAITEEEFQKNRRVEIRVIQTSK